MERLGAVRPSVQWITGQATRQPAYAETLARAICWLQMPPRGGSGMIPGTKRRRGPMGKRLHGLGYERFGATPPRGGERRPAPCAH